MGRDFLSLFFYDFYGVWTQGFTLAHKQVLYCLNQASSLRFLNIFVLIMLTAELQK
jgi:hypothetical protein